MIDDCYNANPMSMRAAIDDLAETARGRRVAVLGDMLELGAEAPALHREIGEHAGERGVELLVAVGPLAAEIAAGFAGERAPCETPAAPPSSCRACSRRATRCSEGLARRRPGAGRRGAARRGRHGSPARRRGRR